MKLLKSFAIAIAFISSLAVATAALSFALAHAPVVTGCFMLGAVLVFLTATIYAEIE
jgi:hypothetical protein